MKLNTPEPDLIFPDIRVPKKKRIRDCENYQEGSTFEKGSNAHVDHLFFLLSVPHALNGAFANICVGPVQEAELQLEWAVQNKDLSQASQLYKVSKNEFKW